MKVLGVVGSPNKDGNTARLVEAVLSGAKEVGHDAEIFYLSDLDIGPLKGEGGRIIYPEDDMARLYPHIESMGAFILGTPIYYDHVSARTKLFIDRLHYYSVTHGGDYRERFPDGVKAITIITYEASNPERYDVVIEWMNRRLRYYWRMEVVASLKAEDTNRKPVEENEALLEEARERGRSL